MNTQRPMPNVAGVSHRFVEARGLRFHIAEAGQGEPVLMLHHLPLHWYQWCQVVPMLAAEYRAICLDFRGAGWSDAPPSGYDRASRVADVLAVMDALGLRRVGLIGHGLGGWTGFALCLQAPERFSHFLALNTPHPWLDRRRALLGAWRNWHTALWEYPYVGRQVLRRFPGLTRALLQHWLAPGSSWKDDALAEFVASSREPAHATAGEQVLWQYVLHDIPTLVRGGNRARRLSVPTLLLAGGADVVTPPKLLMSSALSSNSISLRVVPAAGHMLPEERPETVTSAARELFAVVSSPGTDAAA